MELNENAEEMLEFLWLRSEEEGRPGVEQEGLPPGSDETLAELVAGGYAASDGASFRLTEQGREEGASVVRRHRLAERLLTDVLAAHESVMHEKACRFEHLLDRGLEESICTLLGHPRICPHGKPIPLGKCCELREGRPQSVVFPLTQLKPGQRAKIAYLYAAQSRRLEKLVAMGLLPGALIRAVQTFPSYVFELGHTQFAVDEETASAINLRAVEEEREPGAEAFREHRGRRRRLRFGFRRGG